MKKVFHAEWEECWKNEWELFLSVNLRDERIVGIFGHDIEYRDDQVNRIIIMDYMENGSLQEFLARGQISRDQAVKLIGTLIQGNFKFSAFFIKFRNNVSAYRSPRYRADCVGSPQGHLFHFSPRKCRRSVLYF